MLIDVKTPAPIDPALKLQKLADTIERLHRRGATRAL